MPGGFGIERGESMRLCAGVGKAGKTTLRFCVVADGATHGDCAYCRRSGSEARKGVGLFS